MRVGKTDFFWWNNEILNCIEILINFKNFIKYALSETLLSDFTWVFFANSRIIASEGMTSL